MRLPVVVLAVALVASSVAAGTRADASTAELVAHLDELVAGFAGGAGLYIADPTSSKALYAHDGDEPIITASLYKLAVLAEAERRVDAGELRYTDRLTIEEEDITIDGSFEPAGTEMTIDEALESMITISDNGPAIALWHILGPQNINATLERAGIKDFHVFLNWDEDNVATPRAVGSLFMLLAKRQLISPPASDRMLARLARQQINDRLPAGLPEGVVVAHKTGNLPHLAHDAGIIFTPAGPRVVVAMTWDAYDADAHAFIANVASLVYGTALEPPANARYDVPRTTLRVDAGSSPRVTIPITNTGSDPWLGSGSGSFRLIWEMRDANNTLVATSTDPIALPGLAPGRSANVGVVLAIPRTPGDYKVTLGLVDSGGRALAALGAATATFQISAHQPYLVTSTIRLPSVLHRGEASLIEARYTALPTAGTTSHKLVLAWRLQDLPGARTLRQGTTAIGTLSPATSGVFYASLVAPPVLGVYRLSYELREGDITVSEPVTKTVTIVGRRTWPDDQGGRTLPVAATPSSPAPSSTPRQRFPTPSGLVPNPQLPVLPTAKP